MNILVYTKLFQETIVYKYTEYIIRFRSEALSFSGHLPKNIIYRTSYCSYPQPAQSGPMRYLHVRPLVSVRSGW